jgi:peptide/nickel transport system ATP-binding protein/oligopeptide transport system ATP-binding protein
VSDPPLLEVDGLQKEFVVNGGVVSRLLGSTRRLRAVRDVSFTIEAGETVGLVGESGAGKSTVGNVITRQLAPTEGEVRFRGENIHSLRGDDLAEFRQSVQMVFQDPHSSLDPRYSIGKTIAEPLKIHTDLSKAERRERVAELLETVNLDPAFSDRYPHELSGGQLQRVSIAAALTVDPEFVILDEPVSALDVSVQARILNLLMRLQAEHGLSYLLISHDLGVVKHICDRTAVLYLGEIVEHGRTRALFENPTHPYTEGLLASIPQPDPHAEKHGQRLGGEIPSAENPPSGCSFHPRCAYATEKCAEVNPPLEAVSEDRDAACHHWRQVSDDHEEAVVSDAVDVGSSD